METTLERPPDEAARLEAVRRYDILDTPPDGAFDRVTALAARFCGTPISTITVVDEDRIWFKSTYGIDLDEVGRDPGLCASAILRDAPHVVTDAIDDPRTLNNPLVRGELGLRFYVGVPLRTRDGHRLGTLNVIDVEPREVTQEELDTLDDLAAIVVDELELRLSARQTIELRAAKEAAEFRESLLAGISHEMRTQISILNGVVSLEPDEEFDREAMRGMMRRHVRRLDWLVNQYLDFTAIESDDRAPTVTPERSDLTRLVRDVVEVFGTDADIELQIEEQVPEVLADPNRTRQILVELLNNAVRFGPVDGQVEVRVHGHDGGAVVTVTDAGPGIAGPDPERVFDKLYRGSESDGSGIGLYVGRTLAEAQGGRLTVEPAPEAGARFRFWLPAMPAGR